MVVDGTKVAYQRSQRVYLRASRAEWVDEKCTIARSGGACAE
jgi:hypothetical protein